MRPRRLLTASLIVCWIVQASCAQTPPAQEDPKFALAREVVDVNLPSNIHDMMLGETLRRIRADISNDPYTKEIEAKHPGFSKARADAVVSAIDKAYSRSLADSINAIYLLFASRFTRDELSGAVDFYRTDVARTWLKIVLSPRACPTEKSVAECETWGFEQGEPLFRKMPIEDQKKWVAFAKGKYAKLHEMTGQLIGLIGTELEKRPLTPKDNADVEQVERLIAEKYR